MTYVIEIYPSIEQFLQSGGLLIKGQFGLMEVPLEKFPVQLRLYGRAADMPFDQSNIPVHHNLGHAVRVCPVGYQSEIFHWARDQNIPIIASREMGWDDLNRYVLFTLLHFTNHDHALAYKMRWYAEV